VRYFKIYQSKAHPTLCSMIVTIEVTDTGANRDELIKLSNNLAAHLRGYMNTILNANIRVEKGVEYKEEK